METQHYFLFGAGALLLGVIILRWILSIDRHLKNQKATISLLMMLCQKQGITDDELQKIRSACGLN